MNFANHLFSDDLNMVSLTCYTYAFRQPLS